MSWRHLECVDLTTPSGFMHSSNHQRRGDNVEIGDIGFGSKH